MSDTGYITGVDVQDDGSTHACPLTSVAANASGVPEPASIALRCFGLAGLGWSRRRRR